MSAKEWTYQRGDDYAVVMLPGEDTCTATINITADPEDADKLGAKIAALPDLLAILRPFIEIWDKGGQNYAQNMSLYWQYDNLSKARAIIAKADGKR